VNSKIQENCGENELFYCKGEFLSKYNCQGVEHGRPRTDTNDVRQSSDVYFMYK